VPLNEPSWWYGAGEQVAWQARALSLVASVYSWVADRRMSRIGGLDVGLPVICVGNFTAGGTGKTPFVRWLVGRLQQRNQRPAILTRGFGGRLAGPVWVDREKHSATDVGDEPLLLAQNVPVMVARDRARGLKEIVQTSGEFDVVVMDDGLQNPNLHKDLSIAIIDGGRCFGNGKVIPAGPLRASLGVQASRVAAVVINHGALSGDKGPVTQAITSVLRSHRFAGPVVGAKISVPSEAESLQKVRVLAYAGIGHPERFFNTLEALGAELVEHRVFADHHEVTPREADDLLTLAGDQNLTLVTTEKDWVRIGTREGALKDLKATTRVVPIEMEISVSDAKNIAALIDRFCTKQT